MDGLVFGQIVEIGHVQEGGNMLNFFFQFQAYFEVVIEDVGNIGVCKIEEDDIICQTFIHFVPYIIN